MEVKNAHRCRNPYGNRIPAPCMCALYERLTWRRKSVPHCSNPCRSGIHVPSCPPPPLLTYVFHGFLFCFVSGLCRLARGFSAQASDGGDVHFDVEKVARRRHGRQLFGPRHRVLVHLHPRSRGLHHHGVHVGAVAAGPPGFHGALRRRLSDRRRLQGRNALLAQKRICIRQNSHAT